MQLKRLHDMSDPAAPKVIGVRIDHAGPRQKFSPDLLFKAMKEGWLSIADGKVIVKGVDKQGFPQILTYKIVREPGWYCCHDGSAHPGPTEARAHLAANFAGKPSPDRNNPEGIEKLNAFDCELEA